MNTYSSYKDSGVEWIGDIPSEWDSLKLKYIFSEKPITHNTELNCGSISFGRVVFKDNDKVPISTKKSYQEVLEGEYLINPLNLNYDLKSLRIGLSDIDVVVSSGYIVIKNRIEISKSYYKWLLHIYDILHMKLLGSGVRQTISFNHISNSILTYPPLHEQQQISDYLDYKTLKIDTLIEKTQQKIELLKEQRTSLINTTVTKGLNPNVEMKDSRVEWIGEIPSEWEVVKLKFVGKVVIGLSYSPDNVVDEGEGTLVMRSTNVQNGKPSFHNNVYVNKDIPDRMVTREGDILICSRNGSRNLIGKNCIISKDIEGMTFGVFMTIFRSKYWKLIYWVLNSPVFKSQSGLYLTSTINQLTVSTIKNLTIPFTFNEREQQQIVDYLDKETSRIDKLVDIESKRIYLLKEYRQSLISEVVTGKVDVRDEVLV